MTSMDAVTDDVTTPAFGVTSTIDGRGLHTVRLCGEVGAIDGPQLMAELRTQCAAAAEVLIDVSQLSDVTGTAERALLAFCADAMAAGVRVAVLTHDASPASPVPALAGTIVVQVHAPRVDRDLH